MSATIYLSSTTLPETIDMEGMSPSEGVTCMGVATRLSESSYRCMANVGGALCIIEVRLTQDEAAERSELNARFGYRVSKLELE